MRHRSHRKQVLLFLIAVVLPSLLLVALTLRMISQERELAERRRAEETRRLASDVGQQLLVRLEKIKLQEVSALESQADKNRGWKYVNPEVVLLASLEENRLLLPWELNRNSEESKPLLSEASFAAKIQQAEREELVKKDLLRATELYQESMQLAQHPVQAAYARLLLARALAKSGRMREAQVHYRELLLLSSDVADEHGIPFSFYAASRLLEQGVEYQAILVRLGSELQTRSLLSPIGAYMLGSLAEKMVQTSPQADILEAAQNAHREILEHIGYLEQAMALRKDFPNLIPMANRGSEPENREPLWIPYGEETWLVSRAPPVTGSESWVVAVEAEAIFSSLAAEGRLSGAFPGEIHFLTGRRSEGESLGQNFPGLRAGFRAQENPALAGTWNLQGYFYLLTLLLVLSVTLFGAYLLWRDVRREMGLAEMRSQFVSSVTHELKSPLTAIRMFAETLHMGRSQNPQIQSEYLETIVHESERLTRLLNNVLDFSKIEQGKKLYRPMPASLAEIIQAAARAVHYPLAQRGFDLRIEVEDGMPPVQVDRDALEQAILNLLSNAMKYSGESREIDLRLRRQDGQALIQVTDRGVGIDPKEQTRIFEKFYRVPTPENQLVPGTGLGLGLVTHIVKAHGGRVEVQSAPGGGSTFSIYLPLESQA